MTDTPQQQESAPTAVDSITLDTRPVEFGPKITKENMYEVECRTVATTPNKFEPGKTQLKFGFAVFDDGKELLSEKGEPATVPYFTSMSRGPKLEELFTALGVTFDKNGETTVKPSDVLGTRCRAFITLQPGTKDPTKTYPKIKSLVAN